MKNIINKSWLILVGLMALAVTSCTNKYEYTPADAAGNEVWFDNTQASQIEVSKSENSFKLTLSRVSDATELTVPLVFDADENNIYTVPSSATFAKGSKTTDITITYDPANVEYGTYCGGTISFGESEEIGSVYGMSSFTFKAGATEWVDIETNNSVGSYREDMMTTFFGVDNVVYNVKIQKSVVREGMYRMVNPYGAAYPYNEPGDYDDSKDYYWVINATDPDYVYMEAFHTGMAWSDYGEVFVSSLVANNLANGTSLEVIKRAKPEWFGTLQNGVITMPERSMLISMANYQNGGLYYGCTKNKFAIALPGATIADYTVEAQYNGRLTDVDDNDLALFTINMASDVASVKYVLVPADQDLNAIVQGIIDGSVEAGELTASGDVKIGYDASGNYVLIMVIYNADGEVVDATALEVKLKSSKDAAETWNEVAYGVLTIGAEDISTKHPSVSEAWGLLFKEPIVDEAVLSQSSSDPTKYRIEPFISDGMPLEFTMTNGVISDVYAETTLNTNDGKLYVQDVVTFYGGPGSNGGAYFINAGCQSKFDAGTNTLSFYNAYLAGTGDDAGFYGLQSDTFEITEMVEGASAKTKAAKVCAAKKANVFTMVNKTRKVKLINLNAEAFK